MTTNTRNGATRKPLSGTREALLAGLLAVMVPTMVMAAPASPQDAAAKVSSSRPAAKPADSGVSRLGPGLHAVRTTDGTGTRIVAVPIRVDGAIAAPIDLSAPRSAPAAATALPSTNRGDLLWIDRDHMNAVIAQGDLALAGDGSSLIAGWWLNNVRASLYDPLGIETPLWSHALTGQFDVPVGASQTGDRLAATVRGDDLHLFQESTSVPDFEIPYPANHDALEVVVSRSGSRVVAAAVDTTTNDGWVGCFDGTTGALLWTYTLLDRPEGLDISDDEAFVAVSDRPTTYVLRMTDGLPRNTVTNNGDTQARPAISGDGSILVTGNLYGRIRLYTWNGSFYTLTWQHIVPPTSFYPFVQDVDVSADGQTVVAGVLNFVSSSSYSGILLQFGPVNSIPIATDSSFGDSVEWVTVSRDGSRVLAGSYGAFSGTQGAVVAAYDRGASTPFFEVPDGALANAKSVFAVTLSEDGLFAASGGKAVHARTFGNGGFVAAYSLPRNSARGLNLGGTAQTGGTLFLNAVGGVGELATGFLAFGVQSGVATAYGTFYLGGPVVLPLFSGSVPAGGVLQTSLPIPANPALVGLRLYIQGYLAPAATPAQGDLTNLTAATIQ